jgi:hypothetical protein
MNTFIAPQCVVALTVVQVGIYKPLPAAADSIKYLRLPSTMIPDYLESLISTTA